MSGEIFLDTNILVCVIDERDLRRQRAARELIQELIRSDSACVSWQVVQEFLNVATTKLKPRLSEALTKVYFETLLMPLCSIWPSQAILERAIELQAGHKLQFYDSLIVASALEAGCQSLYSEDLQTGRRFGDLTIENPFKS